MDFAKKDLKDSYGLMETNFQTVIRSKDDFEFHFPNLKKKTAMNVSTCSYITKILPLKQCVVLNNGTMRVWYPFDIFEFVTKMNYHRQALKNEAGDY